MKPIFIKKDSIVENIKNQNSTYEYDFYIFDSIDSTNRFLKDLPRAEKPIIPCCIAEMQTAGRGRFGRDWHSPQYENIYCSSRWRFPKDPMQRSGLSLVVSLAITAMIHELFDHLKLDHKIQIKWPNDLLWQHKKLSGTLIELKETDEVIIGIGINVNSIYSNLSHQVKPWCSLHDITKLFFNRNNLIVNLLIKIEQYMDHFIHHGFIFFKSEWDKLDYLKHQFITIKNHDKILSGQTQGIDDQGKLLLRDTTGRLHALVSGETSLKT